MTGRKIIAAVLKRTGLIKDEFFGPRRGGRFTAARAMAIQMMTAEGLAAKAIGRLVGRDHSSVLYWQSPQRRVRRSAYYQQRRDHDDPGRIERRAAKAAKVVQKRASAVERLKSKPALRHPRKLRFSEAMSAEPAPCIRVERSVTAPLAAIEDAGRRAAIAKSVTGTFFGDPPPGYSALDRRNNSEARA